MPLILILILLCLQASAAAADLNRQAVPHSVPAFMLGFAGGIALHEAGHVVAASAEGYRVGNNGLSLVYSPRFASSSDRLRVSSAGFQSQWLTSEAAFYYRDKAPDLTTGLIGAHLAITAAYLTFLKNHSLGDSVGMAQASGLSTDQIVLIAAVPALLDAWRLFDADVPAWVAPLSIGFKGSCLTAVWSY